MYKCIVNTGVEANIKQLHEMKVGELGVIIKEYGELVEVRMEDLKWFYSLHLV